jgi:precorrin-3B C17-methyltransferase
MAADPNARPATDPTASRSGRLLVVGIGPGDPALLTGQARAALEAAEAVVGYAAYLDQVRPWLPDRDYRPSPIGAERERARDALALAAEGRTVALISSGDAGVYGMASLALEALEAWAGEAPPAVEVVPGVTALLAAAALLGAPLGTDFAAVSLSDLLVPWPTIARRLEAVAAADFVVALYNPASGARRWQLPAACAILARHRAPETPVGIVREAYRPAQQVVTVPLRALPEQSVDMLTVLVVGNSATRRVGARLLTPRGYPAP